jgi:hypothetical protein
LSICWQLRSQRLQTLKTNRISENLEIFDSRNHS